MNARTCLLTTLACILAAAAIYALAYREHHQTTSPDATSASHAKAPAADIEDGTYVVQVRTIMTTPEDTVISFDHVTYFEGDEATSSAEHEVKCESQPISACVPTLTRGYYVRPSGAPGFSAPVTASTRIRLRDDEDANVSKLSQFKRQFEPVFEVRIQDGSIAELIEKTPL